METANPQPETTDLPRKASGGRGQWAGWLRPLRGRRFWLAMGLLALILARVPFIHGDPSDFPIDRNLSTYSYLKRYIGLLDQYGLGREFGRRLLSVKDEAPEFPFMAIGALLLIKCGFQPLVAARLVALAAAILTGLGLFILGRRLLSPAVGLLALWLYALDPLSILIGRSLLPDPLMMAGVTWSFIAAGAGLQRVNGWRAVGLGLLVTLAALAKLPAIFFAPAAALAFLIARGRRRPSTWILLIAAAAFAYPVICARYSISPLAPLTGLNRVSERTNNLMASWNEILVLPALGVAVMRLVLAMTVPGLLLAFAGWIFLHKYPGRRLWLNAWFLTSLFFVGMTIKANTYWAYTLTPPACLLAALALVEFYRIGCWTLAPLAVMSLALLGIDPAVAKVSEYLATQPAYQAIADAARRLIMGGTTIYVGLVPRDLEMVAGRSGFTFDIHQSSQIQQYLTGGAAHYLLSNQMNGNNVVGDIFNKYPVLESRPQQYVLYDVSRASTLGTPLPDDKPLSPTLTLDLAGILQIDSVDVTPAKAAPGDTLRLTVDFNKGTRYSDPPNLAITFIHLPTSEPFFLPPLSGGAFFNAWSRPLAQTPDFSRGNRVRMQYTFEISPQLPAGPYQVCLGLIKYRTVKERLGEMRTLDDRLTILAPRQTLHAPLEIQPLDCLWLHPSINLKPSWFGRARRQCRLLSESKAWLRPNLAPGDYVLHVTGRGILAGRGSEVDATGIWPMLRLQDDKMEDHPPYPFASAFRQTVRIPFHWKGAKDFLCLSIANPYTDYRPGQPLPYYLDELAGGIRAIDLDKLEIRAAREDL